MPAEGGLVRLARADETDVVQAIAVAAGRRFAEVADPRIARCADDPPPAVDVLLAAVAERRLWLAEDDGVAVGFLLAIDLPASVHVEEVSVLPLGDHEIDDAVARIRSAEADHGLDASLRVVMARSLRVSGTD